LIAWLKRDCKTFRQKTPAAKKMAGVVSGGNVEAKVYQAIL
jgi:hypothetical protein